MISAIFEQDFNLDTIAWRLGADVSYIEFNIGDQVTPEKIALAEKKCNELIAQAIPVQVQILNGETTDLSSPEVSFAEKCLKKKMWTMIFHVFLYLFDKDYPSN